MFYCVGFVLRSHSVPIWTGNVVNGYHIPLGSGKVDHHRIEGFFGEQVVAKVAVDLGRGQQNQAGAVEGATRPHSPGINRRVAWNA